MQIKTKPLFNQNHLAYFTVILGFNTVKIDAGRYWHTRLIHPVPWYLNLPWIGECIIHQCDNMLPFLIVY